MRVDAGPGGSILFYFLLTFHSIKSDFLHVIIK